MECDAPAMRVLNRQVIVLKTKYERCREVGRAQVNILDLNEVFHAIFTLDLHVMHRLHLAWAYRQK